MDPFDRHPEFGDIKKRAENILTLEAVRGILYKKIEEVESTPGKTWGFTRTDIVKILNEVLEKAELECHH